MFSIIWHIIIHGHMIENCRNPALSIYLKLIQYIIIIHVNSFIIISGYFQSKSKFKLTKLLSLIIQVSMYSTIIFIISTKLGIVKEHNIISLISNLFPSVICNYWFINIYIILYIFSDYINKFIDTLSKEEYKKLLLLLFIVFSIFNFITGGKLLYNTGYNLYHFIFLYLIGAYLRKYSLKDSYHFKNLSINGYKMLLIIVFFSMSFVNYLLIFFAETVADYSNLWHEFSVRISSYSLSYTTPFVIVQTICYFEFFKYIKIHSKVINYISSCMFGIYLFHDNIILRDKIYVFLHIDNGIYSSYKMIIYMIGVGMSIFLFGLIIEIIRKLIIKFLLKVKFIDKNIKKLKNYVLSFNYEINW